MIWRYLGALLTGVVIGFLGGLFGKGGSAVATPLLSLIGFPGFVAVASPLPATVPSTLVASAEYWRSQLLDWEIFWWSIGVGTPAIVAGSFLSHAVGARPLLIITGALVLGFGIQFLFFPRDLSLAKAAADYPEGRRPPYWHTRMIAVATLVGLISGLLANAGGFLLVPSYTQFLKQPMKKAFACSLAVSTVLAVPGTIVHAYLGHISWSVTGLVALGAVPFSHLGARLAINTRAAKLERWYGLALTGLGVFFLIQV
ncbi:MAG TPA: sulfite exporter TauE/SafE family protein [Dongiaceae bacterium]|nr:sulfite exporter TauE/SafE family protein [Dongiaceae bacterium]